MKVAKTFVYIFDGDYKTFVNVLDGGNKTYLFICSVEIIKRICLHVRL